MVLFSAESPQYLDEEPVEFLEGESDYQEWESYCKSPARVCDTSLIGNNVSTEGTSQFGASLSHPTNSSFDDINKDTMLPTSESDLGFHTVSLQIDPVSSDYQCPTLSSTSQLKHNNDDLTGNCVSEYHDIHAQLCTANEIIKTPATSTDQEIMLYSAVEAGNSLLMSLLSSSATSRDESYIAQIQVQNETIQSMREKLRRVKRKLFVSNQTGQRRLKSAFKAKRENQSVND